METIPIQYPFPINRMILMYIKIRQNQELIPLFLTLANVDTYRIFVMAEGSFILFKTNYILQQHELYLPG